jgi:hypothetical protein
MFATSGANLPAPPAAMFVRTGATRESRPPVVPTAIRHTRSRCVQAIMRLVETQRVDLPRVLSRVTGAGCAGGCLRAGLR